MTEDPNQSQQWSGEMLDRPEMVLAFSTQLRGILREHAEFVAGIRRDAFAMWEANPPEGYSTFEGWWRARWVKSPLAEIQKHLEAAVAATFQLESRYRRGRHEIPAARLAARQAKRPEDAPALGSGRFGDRSRTPASFGRPASGPAPSPRSEAPSSESFLDLVHQQREERSA